jgi:hypothetical protein
VLSGAEIGELLVHTEPGLYRTLFTTIAATGLRPEEAYALQWGDVQFESAQIFVRRSLSTARGADETGRVRPKFYPPKTESGYRVLLIPAALVIALKASKLQCPVSAHDLVFLLAGRLAAAPQERAPLWPPSGVAPSRTQKDQRQDLTALLSPRCNTASVIQTRQRPSRFAATGSRTRMLVPLIAMLRASWETWIKVGTQCALKTLPPQPPPAIFRKNRMVA